MPKTLSLKRFALLLAAGALIGAPIALPQSQSSTLTITLAGQSMIRSDLRVTDPAAMPVISSLLKGDVKFTNFEGVIAQPGQPNDSAPEARPNGGWLDPPGTLGALQALGFNLVSLSNNHAWDLKAVGIQNTLQEAKELNLAHAGIGANLDEAVAPGYLHTPNGTVALIGIASGEVKPGGAATPARPGVNELRVDKGSDGKVVSPARDNRGDPMGIDSNGNPLERDDQDAQNILRSIQNARKHADLVIVYEHNHVFTKPFETMFWEELPERLVPPEWLKKWTHEEIDAGADIIVMHGSPLLHGIEIYKGKPIFYDLGNFIFNFVPSNVALDEPVIWESVVAYLEYQGKHLRSVTFRPVVLNKIGEGQPELHNGHVNNQFLDTRGLPRPATGEQAHYILQRLADLSRPFGTTLEIQGETAVIRLPGN